MKFVLDTDHVSLLFDQEPKVIGNAIRHLADTLAISVITVEEKLVGWLTQLNRTRDLVKRERLYARMAQDTMDFADWLIVPFNLAAMAQYEKLVRQRLNVGSNDLKIAAIAIEFGAAVVTRNRRDFSRVPGLGIVDWSI